MPATAQPMRIDTFLAAPEYFHLSRTQAQKMIDNGDVYVNGTSVLKKSMHVKPNDSVSVAIADLPSPQPQPTKASTTTQSQSTKTTTTQSQSTKKVIQKEENGEDNEGEENDASAEAGADEDGDEADELESGPTTATTPLITPIDILLFYSAFLHLFSLTSPTSPTQHNPRR